MTRRMIEIEPGTESWKAWLAHHRGSKTELVMVKCQHQARPFYAWTEMPPDVARADRLSAHKIETAEAPRLERSIPEGEVEKIADRLEARAARNDAEQVASAARAEQGAKDATAFERAAAAVQSGGVPKLGGLADIGMRMVDDPHELKRGRKPPPLRAKLVNLRDDPIGQMAKRRQIEQEQLDAARRWQALHDVAASVGGSRGIDPSAMKVDGGRFATEPITDAQMASMRRLEQLDRILGYNASIVRRILGDRMTISQLADVVDNSFRSKRQQQRLINRLGIQLRGSLDTLVQAMGVEVTGARRRIPPHERALADVASYADNPPLYRAVREARSKPG